MKDFLRHQVGKAQDTARRAIDNEGADPNEVEGTTRRFVAFKRLLQLAREVFPEGTDDSLAPSDSAEPVTFQDFYNCGLNDTLPASLEGLHSKLGRLNVGQLLRELREEASIPQSAIHIRKPDGKGTFSQSLISFIEGGERNIADPNFVSDYLSQVAPGLPEGQDYTDRFNYVHFRQGQVAGKLIRRRILTTPPPR